MRVYVSLVSEDEWRGGVHVERLAGKVHFVCQCQTMVTPVVHYMARTQSSHDGLVRTTLASSYSHCCHNGEELRASSR